MSKKEHKPLIEANELSTEQKKSVKVRVITSIVIAAILIPALVLGSYYFALVMFLIAGFAAYELVSVSSIKESKSKIFIYIFSIILVESYVFWIFLKNNFDAISKSEDIFTTFDSILTNSFERIEISVIALMASAGVYFVVSFIDEKITINHVFYYFGMTLLVGLCCQSLLYLRFRPFSAFEPYGVDVNSIDFRLVQSWFLLLYMALGSFGNDIFAYFTGILFGKHKVNPRISPKKTWEGFIGGLVLSALLSFGFAFVCSILGKPIFPALDHTHWYWILIVSLTMPIIGDIGDFVFSAVKRSFGIKDFSNLLPGHGGVLDRMDAMFFCSALVSIFVVMISNGWNFLV